MTVVQYDPENWLLTATRALGSYVESKLNDPDTQVEMSFPDTRNWTKTTPLDKNVVHFEQDDVLSPPMGFGVQGEEVIDDVAGTWQLNEAALHLVNYDIGVWVSAENGGATKRMELVQALHNIFGTAQGRIDLASGTSGVNVIAFDGGRNALDRINDVPVWRAMDMMLVTRVYSKHVQLEPTPMPDVVEQDQGLTIVVSDGSDQPVETP